MKKVLFVCTANICRSPTAHAVFQKLVNEQHLQDAISVDSAGTHASAGALADPRSCMIASRKGVNLGELRSRPLQEQDFDEFDYILVMDQKNLAAIERKWPQAHQGKACLLLSYCEETGEVPDPYKGEALDFIQAYELIEKGCRNFLQSITA